MLEANTGSQAMNLGICRGLQTLILQKWSRGFNFSWQNDVLSNNFIPIGQERSHSMECRAFLPLWKSTIAQTCPSYFYTIFKTTTRPVCGWVRKYVGQWWQLSKQLAGIKPNNEMKHRVQTNLFMFNRHTVQRCQVHFRHKCRGLRNLIAAFRRSTFLIFHSHSTPACLVCDYTDYTWFILVLAFGIDVHFILLKKNGN